MRLRIAGSVACASLLVGCTVDVHPPAAPSRELPEVDMPADPPPAHSDRYVLDAPRERAKVIEIVERARATAVVDGNIGVATSNLERPICITPCVVDVERGLHEYRFEAGRGRASTVDVSSSGTGKVVAVRHVIGYEKYHTGAQILGALALALGGIALVGGAGACIPIGVVNKDDVMLKGGIISAAAGAGLMLVGLVIELLGASERQDGSTTTWTLRVPPDR